MTIIYDSISHVNDKKISSSCFMYYLGSKNEDGFVTTAIELGYPLFTKKIDHITTAIM